QVLPDPGHFLDLSLSAEFALAAFAGDAGDFRCEHRKLPDHGVDDGRGTKEFALKRPSLDIQRYGLEEVALGDCRDCARHLRRWPEEVVDQAVDRLFHLHPGARRTSKFDALAGLALATDGLADAFELFGHTLIGGRDLVEGICDLSCDPVMVTTDANREVA